MCKNNRIFGVYNSQKWKSSFCDGEQDFEFRDLCRFQGFRSIGGDNLYLIVCAAGENFGYFILITIDILLNFACFWVGVYRFFGGLYQLINNYEGGGSVYTPDSPGFAPLRPAAEAVMKNIINWSETDTLLGNIVAGLFLTLSCFSPATSLSWNFPQNCKKFSTYFSFFSNFQWISSIKLLAVLQSESSE